MATDCLGRERFYGTVCQLCGATLFETPGSRGPELCDKHKREMAELRRIEKRRNAGVRDLEANRKWIVVKDPCPDPMAIGTRLSEQMVAFGLRDKSWVPGMEFEHLGKRYRVTPALTLRCGRLEYSQVECGHIRRADRRRYGASRIVAELA